MNRIIYTVHKTEAAAKAAMSKMISTGEIAEMEFPFIDKRNSVFEADSRFPWAIWINP